MKPRTLSRSLSLSLKSAVVMRQKAGRVKMARSNSPSSLRQSSWQNWNKQRYIIYKRTWRVLKCLKNKHNNSQTREHQLDTGTQIHVGKGMKSKGSGMKLLSFYWLDPIRPAIHAAPFGGNGRVKSLNCEHRCMISSLSVRLTWCRFGDFPNDQRVISIATSGKYFSHEFHWCSIECGGFDWPVCILICYHVRFYLGTTIHVVTKKYAAFQVAGGHHRFPHKQSASGFLSSLFKSFMNQ